MQIYYCIIQDMTLLLLSSRWIPPPLPTAKSPEREKESGSTYAAGRSRVLYCPDLE